MNMMDIQNNVLNVTVHLEKVRSQLNQVIIMVTVNGGCVATTVVLFVTT